MSYSFMFRAANKAAAKAHIADKVAEIVQQQSVHSADKDAILSNANAIIDLLPDAKEGFEIAGSLSGYVSGEWDRNSLAELNQASISANIGWARKTD